MRQHSGEATVLTGAARTRRVVGPGAEQALAQPEGEALLAHAAWTVQQEARGQGVARDGVGEVPAQCPVSDEGAQ